MKFYVAGPLFTEQEKQILSEISDKINSLGHETYLPMKNGVPHAWSYPNSIWGKLMFEKDKKAIDDCDVLIAVYNGMNSDSGTSWEIGYAYGVGKTVFIFHNYISNSSSLMVYNGCHANIRYLSELEDILSSKRIDYQFPYQS